MSHTAKAGAFASLNPPLSTETLDIVQSLGFERMSPVQAAVIPLFTTNKDVIVEAVTGSGKTLAFVIPIIEILKKRSQPLEKHDVGALVILPTRELATQVAEVLEEFLPVIDGTAMVAVGGTETNDDLTHFNENGAHVIIATPGRIEELMRKSQAMNMKELEILVLDEADRLLDMGFEKSINSIIKQLPKQRRTGLFSATQTQQLDHIIRAGLRNPVRVNVKVSTGTNTHRRSTVTPVSLKNFFMVCGYEDKLSQLVAFMEAHSDEKLIVYMNTCACVDYFHSLLDGIFQKRKTRIRLHSLHGKMVHKKRSKTFEGFKNSSGGALLCTDVAARGLDMPDIDWVVQFDPPQDPDQFVHRCGRTARQGRVGSALLFLAPHEDTYVDFMRKRTVQMREMKLNLKADDIFEIGRDVALRDRSIYEKSLTAFVSFVRSYREHKCSIIFRLRDLDMLGTCRAFALLTLPRMPELKSVSQARPWAKEAGAVWNGEQQQTTSPGEAEIKIVNEQADGGELEKTEDAGAGEQKSRTEGTMPMSEYPPCPVDPATIAYKDKSREAQRQQKLALAKATGDHEHKKRKKKAEQPAAWSQQKERKLIKEKRRDVKAKKREWQHQQTLAAAEANNDVDSDTDLQEMESEARMLKKLRKGKNNQGTDIGLEMDL